MRKDAIERTTTSDRFMRMRAAFDYGEIPRDELIRFADAITDNVLWAALARLSTEDFLDLAALCMATSR